MADCHQVIIDDNGEVIRRDSVFFDDDPVVSPAFEHEPPVMEADALCNGKLNAIDAINTTLETTLGIIFIA